MPEDENIQQLVSRAADGDQAAWNLLIDKYNSLLWWTARGFRLTPEQAADVIQVTWLRLVESAQSTAADAEWAPNIICGLARMNGQTTGFVGNQPAVLAGTIDIAAAEKAARFVRFCDAFGIPLVTLVDVPGFLPGRDQERDGIVRRGAKLVYAYCEATVPRVSVVLRKAYGGAFIAMDSRSVGADLAYAWPSNEIAVMGPDGAASIIHRREIAAADDPDRRRQELAAEYAATVLDPYAVAERGLVDDVIDPADTRRVLIESLALLAGKRAELPYRKHGNGPQ